MTSVRALLLVVVACLLAGCETLGSVSSEKEGDTVSTHVIVRFASPEYIRLMCGSNANACSVGKVIFTPRPRNFDDKVALCLLGHEMFHRLGADHTGRHSTCRDGWPAEPRRGEQTQ